MLLGFIALSPSGSADPGARGVAVYGGPGSPSPLIDIVRLKSASLESDFILTVAYSHPLWTDGETLALEGEAQFTQFLERADLFSVNGAVALRWHKTPWSRALAANVALGAGLSAASGVPAIEARHLAATARTLFHLLMEVAFPLGRERPWEAFLRVHHRSGIFGVFGDVTGGSDFLCLGLRYRFD